jgi:class 3 adenylate cyclase
MPNIRQLVSLKEKYSLLNGNYGKIKDFLNRELLENVAIQKSFSFNEKMILEHFDVSGNVPTLIKYFESKPTEDIVLLFIDIADFSNKIVDKPNEIITKYLDNYYKTAFPIIYKHGGQIEKLMGDGIICLFGKPFMDVEWREEFNKAEICAKELIQIFEGTNKAVKVALHSGEVTYYKTPGLDYEEYTMIGKPITELFRLESISKVNAINFYDGSVYDKIKPGTILGLSKIKSTDIKSYSFDVNLQGVNYSKVRYLKFI